MNAFLAATSGRGLVRFFEALSRRDPLAWTILVIVVAGAIWLAVYRSRSQPIVENHDRSQRTDRIALPASRNPE